MYHGADILGCRIVSPLQPCVDAGTVVKGQRGSRADPHIDVGGQLLIVLFGVACRKDKIDDVLDDLVFATRYPEKYDEKLASYIDVGVSPRASLALDSCSRVYAWLQERDYTTPEDVRAVVHDVFRHRITPSYEAQSERVSNDAIIDTILNLVSLPA